MGDGSLRTALEQQRLLSHRGPAPGLFSGSCCNHQSTDSPKYIKGKKIIHKAKTQAPYYA